MTATHSPFPDVRLLHDKTTIAEATARLAYTQDDRDWPGFRALLADHVHFDLSRHLDIPASYMSADQLTATAQRALSGWGATQHTVTNVVSEVAGDEATCRAHVVAHHYLPDSGGATDLVVARNTWNLALRRLDGQWRFSRIVVVRTIPLEGDAGLYDRARARS